MLKTTNSDTAEFLKRSILSCNSYETHLTMAQWLDRLFDKHQIDFIHYSELTELNQTLMNNKFANLNLGTMNDQPQTNRI